MQTQTHFIADKTKDDRKLCVCVLYHFSLNIVCSVRFGTVWLCMDCNIYIVLLFCNCSCRRWEFHMVPTAVPP